MLDYKGIEALSTVVELGSFEAAAKKLHITQSAISQRIKTLESQYGEAVVVRTPPYKPTQLGEFLIGHHKQVALLEDTLNEKMDSIKEHPTITIALNRDSLETWFLDVIQELKEIHQMRVEILADDQELTLDYLKKGIVSACLSTSKKSILGGDSSFLGDMEYLLVCSPEYAQKHFSHQNKRKCFKNATALKFDRNDHLHEKYLHHYFSLNDTEIKYHIIPSVRGFKEYALLGYGYALIPKIDIIDELHQRQLVNLFPKKTWKIPLYWHHWIIESKGYERFNRSIIKLAQQKISEVYLEKTLK